MLESFRRGIKSWYFKILFGVLVLSFLTWGIGDVVQGGFGAGPAIQVGDTKISATEVESEFRREVERLQPMFGGKLTTQDARKLGLMERTVDSIVARSLIDEAGNNLGLATSDEAVIAQIAADPMFRDEAGNFDRNRLRLALSRAGLSENEFLRIERSNAIRTQMAGALSGPVAAPQVLVDPLARLREERRIAELIMVRADAIPAPAAPAAEELQKYYEERAEMFMAPEYRSLSVLLLRPEDVANEIEVTPEMVEDAYRFRTDEFHSPERREVSQVVLPDDEAAARAAEMIKAGKGLEAVGREFGQDIVDLGPVEPADLPGELADAVFTLAKDATSQPIRTDLGWHVVKVTGISPEQTRSLDKVRDQVTADLRRDLALDRLVELANTVEDTLGAGANLEEAAQRHNLTLVKIDAVDNQGQGPDGKPVAKLPRPDIVLDVAFSLAAGEESQLTEIDGDGYVIVQVNQVTPPAPRPLADISADVVKAWQADQRQSLAGQRAEAIAEQIRKGDSAASAAKAHNLTVTTSQPFTRDTETSGQMPAAISAKMFEGEPGHVALAPVTGGWLVARLAKVEPFDPAANGEAVAATATQVGTAMAADLIDQYLAALRLDLGVEVDRRQLTPREE